MSVMERSNSSSDKKETRENLNEGKPPGTINSHPQAVDSLRAETVLPKSMVKDDSGAARRRPKRASHPHDPVSNSPKEIVEVRYLFKRFIGGDKFRKGLRIQFEPHPHPLFGGNWAIIDLGKIESNARLAGKVSLPVEDDYFDMIFCSGLDRVSRPPSLIAEMRRVLKRRGQIWGQAPLASQSGSELHDHNESYWYVTPQGFKILFESFDEIACSVYQNSLSNSVKQSYFYGIKPEVAYYAPEYTTPYLVTT